VAGAAVGRACAAKLQVLESIILFAAFARISLSYDLLGLVAENVLSCLEECSQRAASRNVFRVIISENGIIRWQLIATRKNLSSRAVIVRMLRAVEVEEKFEAISSTDNERRAGRMQGGIVKGSFTTVPQP